MEHKTPISQSFDYDALDPQTRLFVQQSADAIAGQLKRTAQGVITIGQHLQAVKQRLGHGHFLAWIHAEFGMAERSAYYFINVAEKFGDQFAKFATLPISVLYELAAPSTTVSVVEGVLTGDIDPTLQAVREAKKAEQQARTEKATLEHQLQQVRADAHTQIAALTTQIEHFQQQIRELGTPQVREVPVVPAEITQQLEKLRGQVKTLKEQRETLSKHAEQLAEQVKTMALKHQEEDEAQRIRLAWQTTTQAFESAVLKVLSAWPTLLDTQVFLASDWQRLDAVERQCHRLLDECERLRGAASYIVEADEPEACTMEKTRLVIEEHK